MFIIRDPCAQQGQPNLTTFFFVVLEKCQHLTMQIYKVLLITLRPIKFGATVSLSN
jgi:hypothetical protein